MSGPRIVTVVLAALVSAGIAYAVVSTVVSSNNSASAPPAAQANPTGQSAPAAGGPAWLGVQTESLASAGGGPSSGSGTGGLSSGSGTGGLASGAGAVVTNVAPGSPADAAGLEPGDVITQVNGQPVNSPNDIDSVLAGMHVGQQVNIQYQRGPFADAAQVTLASKPSGSP
jgi:S1-C subfamily serine protease